MRLFHFKTHYSCLNNLLLHYPLEKKGVNIPFDFNQAFKDSTSITNSLSLLSSEAFIALFSTAYLIALYTPSYPSGVQSSSRNLSGSIFNIKYAASLIYKKSQSLQENKGS